VRVTGAKNGRHGAVRCTATTCTYRPKKGYAGTDAFTYTVSDGTLTATGTVTVTVKRKRPLRASATAAPRTARSGDVVTYTVAVTNPNPLPVDLRAVRVCLPPGFTFVGGSTGGALRRAPAAGACGRNQVQLTWSKTPPAPAGGRVAIRFKAHAGTAGSAGLAVAATAGAPFAVTSSGSTATVAVTR
jgi:uncharacterized repeat protein (TIGR01451 family)